MKQRGIRLLAALLLIGLLPGLVLLYGDSLPSFYGDTYYGVLPKLVDRLETAEGPKIVVIGGSNVAFGLDGAYLEQLLLEQGYDYSVCPFGLYAAVGTSAMLDLSRTALGAGDIVVLAIEPTSETFSTYFGATAFWKCAEDRPELLLSLGKSRQAAMVGNYTAYLQERNGVLASGGNVAAEGVYAAASFDDRCDMRFHRAGNAMILGYDTASPVDLAAVQVDPAFAEQIREYCAEAEKKGASVVLSFSPVNRSALTDTSEAAVEAIFGNCAGSLGCRVISDPNRYILDSGWFYDNNFHLNSAGAELRTCLLAEDLLRCLGCWQELTFPAPVMPETIAAITESEGDDACFRFEALGDGWVVDGLTEQGLTAESLTVPSVHEGKPVVGILPHALAGAGVLTELRVPESVADLPDGLFADCPGLQRLILEHRNVPCGISEDTFEGADQLQIHVPREAYPMYRDGYGCEVNRWSEYLDRFRTY